jgi:secondary thiamine-phosphate synthase enzyme
VLKSIVSRHSSDAKVCRVFFISSVLDVSIREVGAWNRQLFFRVFETAMVEAKGPMATMKAHTEYLTFQTEQRYEMVHITPQVEEIVRRSGIEDGLCFVSPMHITAAIYVNDNEDGLIEDIWTWLEKLAPAWPGYKHHRTGEDNADAHLKALLLHHETTLPVTKGRLDLGRWQRVFYAEFDGQRSKRVIVKLLGVARG